MRIKRSNFTDTQRAAIFVRDRATCCFSGANLWLLDAPIRIGYQRDWVDHIRPSARGGLADLVNGVCASHTYNAKKRHNTADNVYLFRNGIPTSNYYEMFGSLDVLAKSRLERLSNLRNEDWYLNRAIGLIFLSFRYSFLREKSTRDSSYWLKSALKQLQKYQQLQQLEGSLEDRLICEQTSDQQQIWLSLREVTTSKHMSELIRPLLAVFTINSKHWATYFWKAKTASEKLKAWQKALDCESLSPEVVQCIQDDYSLRWSS